MQELTLEQRLVLLEQRVQELEDKQPRKKFIKPTFDEVYAEMKKHFTPGTTHDYIEKQSNLFINHYEANGWKVGKVPMKSWKHTIAGTWMNNIKKRAFDGKDNSRNFSDQPIHTEGHGKGRFGRV